MDLDAAEYACVKQTVKDIFDGQTSPALICEAGSSVYRIRRNPENRPRKVKDLREPSAYQVTGFQRCNPPQRPIFYASNRLFTAALETDIQEGDNIYLTRWKLDRPMHCSVGIFSRYYEEVAEINNTIPETSKDLAEFFEFIFTRRVHNTFSNEYKITSAIAEMLTADHDAPEATSEFRSSTGHIALTYKSVVDRLLMGSEEGENFSFHPTLVDEFLSLAETIEAKVTSREGNDICLEILDYSNTLFGQKINWTNDPTAVSFSKELSKSSGSYEGMKWTIRAPSKLTEV